MKKIVHTEAAPKALGPYSQGVVAGSWLFVSGQLGLDPSTGDLVPGGAGPQAQRAFENARAIVETAGGKMANAVRVIVYLADLGDFAAVNDVMADVFPAAPPARVTVQVARLPRDARLEIEIQVHLG